MGRWATVILAILVAAAAGYFVGHVRSSAPPQVQRIESRLEAAQGDATTLRQEKQKLQERSDQVTKEQERLAQENEILRKQQVTDQILTGRGGELPAQPLK